jgi:hypothetical protein
MRANTGPKQLDEGTTKGQWRKVYEAKYTQFLIGCSAIRNARNPIAINANANSNRSK